MKFLTIIFLIFTLQVFGQNSEWEITDTTLIIGEVIDDVYVGKEVRSYCMTDYNKKLLKNTTVIVAGTKSCQKTYSENSTDFFEILYNNNPYFIEKDKLQVENYDYEDIASLTGEKAEKFKKFAQGVSAYDRATRLDKIFKFLEKTKSKGITILNWTFHDESEYTSGTGVKIHFYNSSPKTIKYIWTTFIGFNPVGDKVIDKVRKVNNVTRQGVGPIAPESDGSYEFNYVWYSDLVEKVKILSVKVQYMDGTVKIISNPDEITLSRDLYRVIYEDE